MIGSGGRGQSVIDYPEQINAVAEGCLAVVPEDLDSSELYILMDDDAELIARLIQFGLSEKVAYLDLHLFNYGPKSLSLLAKSLKMSREYVYRMLRSLIDRGVVIASLQSPKSIQQ